MTRIDPEQKAEAGLEGRIPWKVSDAVLATGLVVACFAIVILVAPPPLRGADEETRSLLTPWLTAMVEGLVLAAAWAFTVRKYGASWGTLGLRAPRVRRSFILALVAFGGSIVLTGLYAAIVTSLDIEILIPEPIPADVFGTGITRLTNGIIVVLWGPFAEEIFFRGFLLAALVPTLGAPRALVASAAVFAGAHIIVSSMIPIFITGLLLGWLYLRTKSLWPPITAHALQNLLALSVAP